MSDAFAAAGAGLPGLHDPARAQRTLAVLEEGPDPLRPPPGAGRVLAAAFANSPYLARIARLERETLRALILQGPAELLNAADAMAHDAALARDSAAAMRALRVAKRRAALTIALADIGGLWSLETVTRALTRFADAAVAGALRFCLREAWAATGAATRDLERREAESGLVMLAMGKWGAFELNYSSDIDLVVFYEADRFPFRKKDDVRGAAIDLVRRLVALLAETTTEGYVFRVDLRLRPDAGSTQIAISTDAAEAYYEGMGQNWERAALIKARACAGDLQAGARFLKALEPFVWRRNLDFAAIEDIHSIKRQILAHGGHGAIALAGHNIKLGRGGIREIEFFAQTQQLILGGRDASLRPRGTLDALAALSARGHVAPDVAADLTEAYRFLRTLEHRLQMIEDEQTHTIPKSPDAIAHVARFAGFADVDAFRGAVLKRLERVQAHYARLFERASPLAAAAGSLVFTGVEDDPETLETLRKMGFRDASHVAGAIRGWHHGRIRATRGPRARELLTRLVPALLGALAATVDPDAAFAQFDRFLTRLSAGVTLFSLFLAHPQLLTLIATIMGSAPRLADHMGRTPATLDALLDPGFLGRLPGRSELDRDLAQAIAQARGFEGALDAARRFAREQNFRVGAQLIDGVAESAACGPAFANIAECVIASLACAVEDELAQAAGRVEGGAFCVIAMGKLGGREMNAASDLDLIFVYDAPPSAEASNGTKPLPVSTYYARLAQRLIAALTVATAEGPLYDVDMRLRPTGNKGPVAVSLESFRRYHAQEAWTWERLALTRARVVAGPAALTGEVEAAIRATLAAVADPVQIARDARDMRERLAAQFPGRQRWDLKFAPGGLVDIEFVAQTLQLQQARALPAVLHTGTIAALEALAGAGVLARADATTLIEASSWQQTLTQILRIAIQGTLEPSSASAGLKTLLVRACGMRDFAMLETALTRRQDAARAVFERLLPG